MATDEEKTEKVKEEKEKAEEPKTMEALVNLPRPGLEPQVIKFLLELPKEARNNLLSLSDEELAQLGTEELEKVKRAKEQYIDIKKADREVQSMMSEDQFVAAVQQKMDETGLSQEEAELLVRHSLGLTGPKPFNVIQPPAQSPIMKAFENAAAEKLKEVLFPKGDGGEDKGKGTDLAQTLKLAQERGVQSFFLHDGTEISLNPKDTFGDELLKTTLDWGKEKLQSMLKGEGEGGGNLSPDLLTTVQNPDILRILLEDRAKTAEIEATKIIAESKSNAMTAVATLAATLISPEGYAKVKSMIDLALGKVKGPGETPQDQPPPAEDKFTTLACLKCTHPNTVQKGTPKFICEKCGAENLQDWETERR